MTKWADRRKYHQTYWVNNSWGQPYSVRRTYDKASNTLKQTYPSGHTVKYNYDSAGRLGDYNGQPGFSGNLGDGVLRTYADDATYDAYGVRQERFGTQTPLYHKLHYNVRGQLFDVRLSTISSASDQWNWNRGALLNYYSAAELMAASNAARSLSGSGNNGNLVRAGTYVPLASGVYTEGSASSYAYHQDDYSYDALNRIASVTETVGGTGVATTTPFKQSYAYDRFGNRTIDAAQTWGAPSTQFSVEGTTNRLSVPAGLSGRMDYDAAGNLVNDAYSAEGATASGATQAQASARRRPSMTATTVGLPRT
jgi:hypothetical protein